MAFELVNYTPGVFISIMICLIITWVAIRIADLFTVPPSGKEKAQVVTKVTSKKTVAVDKIERGMQ
jgi:hypothetical protein